MAYQVQTFQAPPLPPDLQNARTFQQLRESVKGYLGLLTKFHNDTFQTLVRGHNQNFQGTGPPIAAASTMTIVQPIHTVTGTATVDTIHAPKGFQGGLVLHSLDGFSLARGGNIEMIESPNYLGPGAYVHLTFHANENRWMADTCRLFNSISGGSRIIDSSGSTAGQVLMSGGPGVPTVFSTALYPADIALGDLLYGNPAHTIARLADVALGQVLCSGGVGAIPAYSPKPYLSTGVRSGVSGGADPAIGQYKSDSNTDFNIAALLTNASAAVGPQVVVRHSRGTIAAPTATGLNDSLGGLVFEGYDGTNYGDPAATGAAIGGVATEAWTPAAQGTRLDFYVVGNGTAASQLGLSINHNTEADFQGKVTTPRIQVSTGVTAAGGLKHQRVTTGAIGASATADVTLTWTAPFADANYTVNCNVVEATGLLQVLCIKSATASQVVVSVKNNDGVNPLTGTLHFVAMHD